MYDQEILEAMWCVVSTILLIASPVHKTISPRQKCAVVRSIILEVRSDAREVSGVLYRQFDIPPLYINHL